MNFRVAIPLLALSLALAPACSRDKNREQKQKLQGQILDEAPPIEHKLDAVIDDKLELLGYKLEPKGVLKVGQRMKLTLYWRPTEKIEPGYILFTHLLDGSGERVWNIDNNGTLRKGEKYKPALPPSEWEPGKVYVDQMSVKVPAKIKTDRMQIVAGLTKSGTDDRLPVTKGKKDTQNRAFVATVAVTQAELKVPKTPKLPSVSVEKLDSTVKIKIDGKLDEEAWNTAPVLGPFVDVKTGEPNKTFPVNGSARMLWNDEGLYVAFEVQDKDLSGGFKKGEKDPHLWTKDAVELMIDPGPEGDNEDYYEIQIGPQNLVFDTQFDKYGEPKTEPDGPFGHQEWASNLKSAVVVDGTLDKSDDEDKGYVVEAFIPWKSFGKAKTSPPAPGDTWRMNLYAVQANDGVAWSPILGQGTFHRAPRFGKVKFTVKGAAPAGSGSAAASAVPSGAPSGAPAPAVSGAVRGGGVAPREIGAKKAPTATPIVPQ
jgi:hypothetical protein